MTKPQIWVAIFLFVFIALFILGRLTKEEEVLKKAPNTDVMVDSRQVSTDNLSRNCLAFLDVSTVMAPI